MDEKQKAIGKREIVLIAFVFVAAAIFFVGKQVLFAKPAAIVEISVVDANSKRIVLETFNLFEDTEYTIVTDPSSEGEPEGTNHLIIQNGTAWISEANCPNHDCMKKGKISQNGEMIVCIPHRLTVTVLGE